MKVNLHGVRGSLPSPLRNKEYREKILTILRIYERNRSRGKIGPNSNLQQFFSSLPMHLKFTAGGDTTCVSVESFNNNTYIIDFGTGCRVLGDSMVPKILSSNGNFVINAFVTHTHWDHIQALPFFKPLYFPQVTIRFHSPYEDLEERLIGQMKKEYFPVTFQGTASKKEFILFKPGEILEFENKKLLVETHPLKHPGGSYAYKFTENGKRFIFATDAEFTGEDWDYIREISPFFLGADLMVLDSQYTLDESFTKFDWGHTSYTMAVNVANHWQVRNLVLTHHEPSYSDKKVFSILEDAQEHLSHLKGSNLKIYLAREGMSFTI